MIRIRIPHPGNVLSFVCGFAWGLIAVVFVLYMLAMVNDVRGHAERLDELSRMEVMYE